MSKLAELFLQDVQILVIAVMVSVPGPLLGFSVGSLGRKLTVPLPQLWPWSIGWGVFVNFITLVGSVYYFTHGIGYGQNSLAIPGIILFCVLGASAGACVFTAVLVALLRQNYSQLPPQSRPVGKLNLVRLTAIMVTAAILVAGVSGLWYTWRKPLAVSLEANEARHAFELEINRRIHPSFQLYFDRLLIESHPNRKDPALIDDAAMHEALTQTRAAGIALEMISIAGTRITDESLVSIGKEKQLYSLNLGNTEITDKGLTHINSLPQLSSLYLDNTEITDKGLTQIKSLPQLRSLRLADTSITDDGLAVLPLLPRLEYLNLNGTKVCDAAVDLLLRCPSLLAVQAERTSMTPAGLKRLQTHLRNVQHARIYRPLRNGR